MFNRYRTPEVVYAHRDDCIVGYELYKEISRANESGLPPHIFKFWDECLSKEITGEGLTRKEVQTFYKEFYRTRIGDKATKKMIEVLCEAGKIYEDKDPYDKRFIKIYALDGGSKNFTQVELQERMEIYMETAKNIAIYVEGSNIIAEKVLLHSLRNNCKFEWSDDDFERVKKNVARDGYVWPHKMRPGFLVVTLGT